MFAQSEEDDVASSLHWQSMFDLHHMVSMEVEHQCSTEYFQETLKNQHVPISDRTGTDLMSNQRNQNFLLCRTNCREIMYKLHIWSETWIIFNYLLLFLITWFTAQVMFINLALMHLLFSASIQKLRRISSR